MNISADVIVLLPELVLAVGAMVLLLIGALGGGRTAPLVTGLAVLLVIASGVLELMTGSGTLSAFHGAFIDDSFGRFAIILILIAAGTSILLAGEFFAHKNISRFELPVLILLGTLGMMLMVSASNFISLYMGLELQNLALYVLASFDRDNTRSTEAGLKYFVLSSLSSGLLLYGISLIYGFAGSTSFETVAAVIHHSGVGIGLIFGMVFLIAGLAFKISAVPFHMWTPDVYQGSPTPISAYFSTAAKVAGMIFFMRPILVAFPDALHEWRQIIVLISILSMGLGTIAALGQTNIKRLMAYSSISHMGYALLGLAAGTAVGVRGTLIYLAIYIVTNLGVFTCIQAMRRDGEQVENISDMKGMYHRNPKLAFAFSALFLSLSGMPPLAGFFAKIYVFMAALQAGLYTLAILGVLASVIGLAYYIRLVKVMFFDEPEKELDTGIGIASRGILTVSSIFILFFIVGASPIITAADAAAKALLP